MKEVDFSAFLKLIEKCPVDKRCKDCIISEISQISLGAKINFFHSIDMAQKSMVLDKIYTCKII